MWYPLTNTVEKTTRKTKKTQRFGKRISSVNKDSLFEALSSSDSAIISLNAPIVTAAPDIVATPDAVHYVAPNSVPDSMNYHELILKELDEVSVRLGILEEKQISAIVERKISAEGANSFNENFSYLKGLGLPAKSKEDLNNLEFELNKSVNESLVSISNERHSI